MRTVIRNSYTPKTGDYCNTIVVDQDKGTQYIFDSDGVPTTYTSKQQEGAPLFYVDSAAAAAKNDAESYADAKDAIILQEAKDYADTHGGGGGSVTVDDELSGTSTNPVQNRVITAALSGKPDTSDLAIVATTGSYSDLTGTPTIPIVNNATLTIQKNNVDVATFTANSSSNATANITVPVINMTTTDPGEGSALAENTFIGVYS